MTCVRHLRVDNVASTMNGHHVYGEDIVDQSALESLAAFLDRVSDPKFKVGEWISHDPQSDNSIHMPYFQFEEVVQHFIQAAYDNHWLDTDLDWSEWANSPEAVRLIGEDETALRGAGPKKLSQLLTVSIRKEKFFEGSLKSDFDSGLILRIVQRADEIVKNSTARKAPVRKLSSLQAGGLGERLALAKLNSLGVAAYTSPEGAPGHDLIAMVDGKAKSIEVKTRQFLVKPSEITRWPVNLETKGDADFFLFVELDLKTISPTFYLLTCEQAKKINKSSGKGQGNCNPVQVRLIAKRNDFSLLLSEFAEP